MTVTATQYAEMIGYSPAAITKRLKSQQPPYKLPYAMSVKKFGNTWMIELEKKKFNPDKAAKEFKNNLVNSN